MKINRAKNTIAGTMAGTVYKVLALILPFISRTIFIRTLGMEYLGLNGLFTSLLQVLNLAELGVGSALVFSMYKPIADDDENKICALLGLYRKYYYIIGIAVLAIGALILPFLQYLIKGDIPKDINIYVIYGMQLSSSVLSYWLFAYRSSLLSAHQRLDVTYSVQIVISILTFAVQVIILYAWRNYYLYLAAGIILHLLTNFIVLIFTKRLYPQYSPKGELEKSEIREINQKARSLFTAKFATVIHHSFDTIVISAFLGLTLLAKYQNYYYIVTSLTGIIMTLFDASQAGVGNYLVTKEPEDKRKLLYNLTYIDMFILAVSSSCLLNLYQPFMKIWVGEKNLLDFKMVLLFVDYFSVNIFLRPLVVFKDAGGIWKEDRWRPLAAALTNLFLNLLTVKIFGLYGVIASTIISFLFVAIPWLIRNINRYQFEIDIKRYLSTIIYYAAVIASGCIISYFICTKITIGMVIPELVIKLFISGSIPLVLFISFFSRKPENKYLLTVINRFVRRKT